MQRAFLAAFVAGLCAMPASAQAQTEQPPLLGEIIVTASRTPQPLAKVFSDVSVLERADIEQSGQATLVAWLQSLPGVEINQTGGAGSTSSVFLRGANSQHTLVLVDGVRMTSATLGSARLEHIPLELVERIEVVRGPMSHLYGSDAIGGVIQIFTRRAEGARGLSASAGAGGYGRKTLDAALSGQSGAWRYVLAAGHGEQNGFSAKKLPNYPDRDGYDNDHLSFNLELAVNPVHTLRLHGMAVDGKSQFDDDATPFDSRSHARTGNGGLMLASKLNERWTSTLRADYAHEQVRTQGQSVWGSYASRIAMNQWQYAWQLDGRTGMGDVQTLVERLEQDVGGDVGYTVSNRTRDAALLGWRREVGAHGFQASVRHDDDSQFGGKTTGAAGYSLEFAPAWRASLSYGTAYRAPAFDDLYWPGSGNPALTPEQARNLEVGLKFQAGERRFGAFVYKNDVKGLIQWAPTGPGGAWQPSNVARARLQGISLNGQERMGNRVFRASLDLQSPEDSATGHLLILRARQHAALGLDYDQGPWRWSADAVVQGERYNDAANTVRLGAYGLLHLSAAYRLHKDWLMQARLENALDKRYAISSGYNTPGRNLFVTVRYEPR